MKRATAALVVALAAGSVALVGCSSSSTPAETSTAAASSAAEQGGSTSMLPPVIIAEDQTEATAKVGDYLDILVPANRLAGTTVHTDNKDLVELTQGGQEGDALMNPGGKVLAPGTAIIEVIDPDSKVRTITLTITE